MKQMFSLCVRELRGGEKKPLNKHGLQYLCFYIYICTRQVYPFNFFLKRTVQKEKSLTKKETHNTILSISTFLIIIILIK